MIRIRNESDFRNWFKKNYKKLGFSKILKSSTKSCPDFVMLEGDKEIKVELEIKSSNFNLHHHSEEEVDKVVCAFEDVKLNVPTIVVEGMKLIDISEKESYYSFNRQVLNLFKKHRILTTPEVSKFLNISYGAAERALLELGTNKQIERIKKKGVTLWLLK